MKPSKKAVRRREGGSVGGDLPLLQGRDRVQPTPSRHRFDSLSVRSVLSFAGDVEIASASFAYPRLDGLAREKVSRSAAGRPVPPGVFVLSTCLRLEVAVSGSVGRLDEVVTGMVGAGAVAPETRSGRPAVSHLFRVAAGLESPIPGEVEVLTQFRDALAEMKERGPVDGRLLKILESAVAAGRTIRASLPVSGHRSMASVAVRQAGDVSTVAVVGSGNMARSVLSELRALPSPPEVTMVARPSERLAELSEPVVPLDRLADILRETEVVVSATAASKRLLDRSLVEAIVGDRDTPLTLIDLAMPPDFDSPDSDLVTYIGIDQLARLAQQELPLDHADHLVDSAAGEVYRSVSNHHRSGPLIASMLASADRVVEETVDRFAGRLTSEADREVLLQTAHTVARTLMNRPVAAVRSAHDPALMEAVSTIFGDDA